MLRVSVRGLSPAYFAMVMATGIVSLGAVRMEMPRLGGILFAFNIAAYGVIWMLTILRAAWYPRELWRDLVDHQRGPAFFTTVAATGVLGAQFVVIERDYEVAQALWSLSLALWLGVTYTVFAALTIKKDKPPLDQGISGAWLLAVVATQSVAVLSAYLAANWPPAYRLEANFLALSMWLWGGMLYIWMIALIFYRYTFYAFAPSDLAPPYWINMGAMAISTLAGSLLILNAPDAPLLASLAPFIKGFTILYWATGTWWIPMLLVLVVWRHLWSRFPLRYDPLYWGAVFPIGMYAVCTLEMAQALQLPYLYAVPRYVLYAALLAWALALGGLFREMALATIRHLGVSRERKR
ncbi:MAG TPA: tellurite resistance/C4-dicarboxylate transporter family protein [Casimicrobiaceae bacterium]|nr:tellurite resistance/C4-dicarboxylate transporter family protein [Casimicrobiaceae bacterium]